MVRYEQAAIGGRQPNRRSIKTLILQVGRNTTQMLFQTGIGPRLVALDDQHIIRGLPTYGQKVYLFKFSAEEVRQGEAEDIHIARRLLAAAWSGTKAQRFFLQKKQP